MIADCETCNRKQVPCSSCQESQRAICFICQGDLADPYCELEDQPKRRQWADQYGARWYLHCDGWPPHDDDNDYVWTGAQWSLMDDFYEDQDGYAA